MRWQTVEVVRLLAQRLTHAHPHRALDLSLDRQWVDRMAAIKRGPHVIDGDRASRLVDRDFNDLCCVAEAHGRSNRSALVLAALCVRRAGECSLHLNCAASDQGLFHHLGKRQARLAVFTDQEHLADAFDVIRSGVELASSALIRIALRFFAASMAALPTMKVMRDEYAPMSFGVIALSAATTRTRSSETPSVSATAMATIVEEPWPISAAPVNAVTLPSKSSFRLTTACGSPVQ